MTSSVSPRADQGRSTLSGAALMTVDDVAAAISCSARTVRRLADDGTLHVVRIRGLVRFKRDEIDAWIAGDCQSSRPARTR